MALPDFKQLSQDTNAVPDWARFLDHGQFISYKSTYTARQYLQLFDEYKMPCAKTGDIRYYVYDPVKHGADPNGMYPVTVWFHGLSNSLMQKDCIMCCGAEQFASPKYQQQIGGCYIIVPLCNEVRQDDGTILGGWCDDHLAPVKAICDRVIAEHAQNIGKKFVMGASSGGYFTWRMLETYPDFFDGAIPISSGYIPSNESLNRIAQNGTSLLIAHGRHDEMALFDECVEPHKPYLEQMQNCLLFFPELVYNGDGGVSSVFYGSEMGQHCMINWIQHNLMFDDGTPADPRLPQGVTGWIRSVIDANAQ